MEYFKEKIRIEGECWVYPNKPAVNGYIYLSIDNKKTLSHRLFYRLFKGGIPKNSFVLHKCDNKRCCNPEHLFIGTQKDNMQDMISKNRQKFFLKEGMEHPFRKINIDIVKKIRKEHETKSFRELAKIYGLGKTTIEQIINKRIWKNV